MHPLIPPRLASPNSKPTYWYPSIARTHPRKKLAKVLQYLDESYQKRPQLFVTSFDEVEIHSRKSGSRVNTREGGGGVEKSLEMIDESFFGDLKKGLDERGLGGWVEVVVVGVTGMAGESSPLDSGILLTRARWMTASFLCRWQTSTRTM